jgi:DNA-binding response OmpR family regulator
MIALSSRETVADFLALRLAGVDDVLQMPMGVQDLLQAVETVLAAP